MTAWIDVEDRVPLNSADPVLVALSDGFHGLARYSHLEGRFIPDVEHVDWPFDREEPRVFDCGNVVTHWMPLPDTPSK